MLVVAFHACDKLAKMDNANPAVAFPVGLTGVDIFFVVSGFIIFVTARQSDATPLGFMRKRLIRVVPLYWVLTLFLAAVAIVKPDVLATHRLRPAGISWRRCCSSHGSIRRSTRCCRCSSPAGR